MQGIQTHCYQSSDFCSSSQDACFNHRIIPYQSGFLGKSCILLKDNFFLLLVKRLALLITSLKSGGDFTGTHGKIEKNYGGIKESLNV